MGTSYPHLSTPNSLAFFLEVSEPVGDMIIISPVAFFLIASQDYRDTIHKICRYQGESIC